MYRTCLFCNRDMGTNQVIETLPIGRRIAFDSAQGRLWVVCRHCEKWNLVPFDTRLESIEIGERLFRGTKARYSTENIGIARLPEGLELVRIGRAERPEFAAWRYGDQFGRRRRRTFLAGAAVLAMAGTVAAGQLTMGLSFGILPSLTPQFINLYQMNRIVGRIPERDGVGGLVSLAGVHRLHLREAGKGNYELSVPVRDRFWWRGRRIVLRGDRVMEGLGWLLPGLNAGGGSRRHVDDAVTLMEEHDPGVLLQQIVKNHWQWKKKERYAPLIWGNGIARLALEMKLHETSEQAALAGELALLERQWREANDLAAIADTLALPADLSASVDDLRNRRD